MGKRKKHTEGITVGVSYDLNLMGLKKPIIRGILEDLHRSSRGGRGTFLSAITKPDPKRKSKRAN